ncbi:hypothetical protein SAMN02745664_1249 [Moraxella cuniculi DSM 21768]|uniref:Uncharacterized protein n=1 Tax=Moraxella cuniculi DSM 21768 TaxID=1122245 RepID=A0A1N7G6B7_9GAMM|nr:hypothetical protein [Moraxella cuniculi]OOS04350.1 hypothetical protein B0189_08545 [Moraxella cuniculi]SIS08157.1 hypothetical protein SAMN02745664_1249 [Moraxella cuniculi DSM 21768]
MTIREILEQYPLGLTIQQLHLKSGIAVKEIKQSLKKLPVVVDGEHYILYDSPASKEQVMAQISTEKPADPAPTAPMAKRRHRPFRINPTLGYQVVGDKIKIFLERRACSRTLTLSKDDLRDLIQAVEKTDERL